MKKLGHIILAIAMVMSLSFGVSAQNDDHDQKKPKKKPPVINPGEKPPRGNPKGGGKGKDRPGKPGMAANTTADPLRANWA